MELPALKVGKPRPTPVVRGGITCIRWCARGLALGDAIKKVQVDMEVAENCLANKKRNM